MSNGRASTATLIGKGRALKLEARLYRVVPEHLYGFKGVLGEILADDIQLLQDVVGDRDDVAANGVGVEDIEQFARAGPDELLIRVRIHDVDGGFHQGPGSAAGFRDAPRTDRTAGSG